MFSGKPMLLSFKNLVGSIFSFAVLETISIVAGNIAYRMLNPNGGLSPWIEPAFRRMKK